MDKLITLLKPDDLSLIIAGSFDMKDIPPEKHRGLLILASHCCLNGPVGTGKSTNFPVVGGPTSINLYSGFRVSNNSWKSFCSQVATALKQSYPGEVKESQQFKVMGDLWPIVGSISESRASGSK